MSLPSLHMTFFRSVYSDRIASLLENEQLQHRDSNHLTIHRSIQTPVTGPAVFTISYDPSITTLSVYLNDKLIRQVKTFGLLSAGYEPGRVTIPFDPKDKGPEAKLRDKEVWVGVMGCAPKGPKGPESEGEGAVATFRRFEMREGVRS